MTYHQSEKIIFTHSSFDTRIFNSLQMALMGLICENGFISCIIFSLLSMYPFLTKYYLLLYSVTVPKPILLNCQFFVFAFLSLLITDLPLFTSTNQLDCSRSSSIQLALNISYEYQILQAIIQQALSVFQQFFFLILNKYFHFP